MSSVTENTTAADTIAVRADHLEKRFNNLQVIRDVSLSVTEGSVLSIIGVSGSGKSTLLRCLNLLEMPDVGELSITGEQVRFKRSAEGRITGVDHAQMRQLRSRVAMVFQEFNLWPHLSVLGNVTEAPIHF